MKGFIHNGIVWGLDPNQEYAHMQPEHIAEALGLIPTFISPHADDVVQEAIDQYGFHMGGSMGGEVTDKGVYQYPGDSDLHPYAICKAGGKIICVYPYGMISFVDIETKEAQTFRFD